MSSFTNSGEVFDAMTKALGSFCLEATGKKVVLADEHIIPKVEGEFILLDLSGVDQLDWQDNEWQGDDGRWFTTHNYTATYTLTAYRGLPHATLARVLQAMNLPYIYGKYFGDGFPYAYSSSSTITRIRVPLNAQYYETRARVQIIFNVSFLELDTGDFGTLEEVIIDAKVKDQSLDIIDEFQVSVKNV